MKKFRTLVVIEGLIILLIILVTYRIIRILTVPYDPNNVSVLQRSDLIFPKSDGFSYFYEPKPDTRQKRRIGGSTDEVIYSINADTLNSTKNYPLAKADAMYRILAIGDSFTFGEYVNTNENWVSVLERALNSRTCPEIRQFETINAGVYGYDISYSVHRLKARGLKYNPDVIILFINDWMLLRDNETFIPLEQKKVQERVPYFNSATGFYDAAVAADMELRNTIGEQTLAQKNIDLIASIPDIYRGDVVLVSFTSLDQTYQRMLTDLVTRNPEHFSYTTIRPVYLDRAYALKDHHPNTKGHQYIADALRAHLTANIIPCQTED